MLYVTVTVTGLYNIKKDIEESRTSDIILYSKYIYFKVGQGNMYIDHGL